MTQEITEMCPYCGEESTIKWDIESQGYQIFCPVCGEAMMLCSMCDRAPCDWKEGVGCKHSDERYRKGRWISVEERLPEKENKTYLVTCQTPSGRHHVKEAYCEYVGETTRVAYWTKRINGKVIAGKPLPDPYRKGDAIYG